MTCPPSTPSLAARSNQWPLVALGYGLWRTHALTLLSGRRFSLAEEYGLMLKALNPVYGGEFADLGTSTGFYAQALLKAGAKRVYGLDLSPAMLRVAQHNLRQQPGFVPLLADAQRMPLANQSLDGVTVGGSWNEFTDPAAVVQEVYRVLKPGGRLWIMFAQPRPGPLRQLLQATGLHFPQLQAVVAQLEAGGFAVEGWLEGRVGFIGGAKVAEMNPPQPHFVASAKFPNSK